jgi:Zn-dependent membrane protease YugP
MNSFPQLLLINCAFAATTIFSLVTLPVEYDASHVTWREMLTQQEHEGPKML